ncbi:MAG: NUDIX domain-containing protein [Methylococcales bacterium]|jgi:ADP-ribose pyrophosphatase|nr:NUDIX domain-containing protein [Methylococcales bacterium]MBT7443230.1 NUDIX domain-containing protein [Methylococcales bacterium]
MNFTVKSNTVVYQGFFQLQSIQLTHALFAGGESAVLTRELLERGNAVAVLMYDPVADAVVMVEQFRIGALHRPQGAWLMELCAGVVEQGESDEEVARREAVEESGCELLALEKIAEYFVSPGGTTERISLYCALVDSTVVGDICGLESEGEDIKVHVIAAEALLADVFQHDSATVIIALQWLQHHRSRLQNGERNL